MDLLVEVKEQKLSLVHHFGYSNNYISAELRLMVDYKVNNEIVYSIQHEKRRSDPSDSNGKEARLALRNTTSHPNK